MKNLTMLTLIVIAFASVYTAPSGKHKNMHKYLIVAMLLLGILPVGSRAPSQDNVVVQYDSEGMLNNRGR